ncbi:MAG TPA: HAD family hydrolase [Pyrinomonadaceae bacterium]|nr:HAD family hydrolase [Pyrinomonadaceae bacterium]
MIRILMLDLGDTLAHNDSVFPHVSEALETLSGFKTADGKRLQMALVSDFTMPGPPVTPAKIETLFQQYIAIVKQLGLSEFFKPFKRHITLSTHAGVTKPDRRVFELAITRLGLDATLSDCLFITENAGHISACQQLGMATLRFGSEAEGGDFDDWSEAPLLVSQLIDSENDSNFHSALKLSLSSKHEMELLSMEKKEGARVRARAQQWHSVPNPKAGNKEDVEVRIPVDVEIDLNKKGGIRSVKADQPDSEAVADAASFVETLAANEQVTDQPGPLPPGATHRIETDEKGRKRLVRKRYSAI